MDDSSLKPMFTGLNSILTQNERATGVWAKKLFYIAHFFLIVPVFL